MQSKSKQADLNVAIVQHAPVFMNLPASVDKAVKLIEEAAEGGAELIVFPETWLPGYPVWLDVAPKAANWDYAPAKAMYRVLVQNALQVGDPHFENLQAVAERTGAYIVMGAHERWSGTLYNSLIIFDRDGERYKLHRKLIPTYAERLVWGRGDGSTLEVLEADFGRLGGLVCWEHWMPLARMAMHAQDEAVHVAQWPSVEDNHQLASRSYAFEGQCFVLAAGSVLSYAELRAGIQSLENSDPLALELIETIEAGEEDLMLNGGSAVVLPNAAYLAGPVFDEACILRAELDLGLRHEGHLTLDTSGHYARPDVFRLDINTAAQEGVVFQG